MAPFLYLMTSTITLKEVLSCGVIGDANAVVPCEKKSSQKGEQDTENCGAISANPQCQSVVPLTRESGKRFTRFITFSLWEVFRQERWPGPAFATWSCCVPTATA